MNLPSVQCSLSTSYLSNMSFYKFLYLFPAASENGVITNNTVYNLYRRICKSLVIKISRKCIKGPHSFRRNAVTDVVNATDRNILIASKLFGNSPEVAKNNYYTGLDMDKAREILDKRAINL